MTALPDDGKIRSWEDVCLFLLIVGVEGQTSWTPEAFGPTLPLAAINAILESLK